jgi:hypothetical protein
MILTGCRSIRSAGRELLDADYSALDFGGAVAKRTSK